MGDKEKKMKKNNISISDGVQIGIMVILAFTLCFTCRQSNLFKESIDKQESYNLASLRPYLYLQPSSKIGLMGKNNAWNNYSFPIAVHNIGKSPSINTSYMVYLTDYSIDLDSLIEDKAKDYVSYEGGVMISGDVDSFWVDSSATDFERDYGGLWIEVKPGLVQGFFASKDIHCALISFYEDYLDNKYVSGFLFAGRLSFPPQENYPPFTTVNEDTIKYRPEIGIGWYQKETIDTVIRFYEIKNLKTEERR
jgi:hypothetical protein